MEFSQILKSCRSSFSKIKKANKDFAKKLDCKDIKFPVNFRDIRKIAKTNSISISAFGYENKEKHPVYVSKKCCEEKHVDLLPTEEKDKRHYVLIKDFNTFTYSHILHHGKKHFYRYCLQDFSTKETFKRIIKGNI